MVQRSLVTGLAALGALLIILGGIFGFLLSFGRGSDGGPFLRDSGGAFAYGAVAVILGLLVLFFSGYTHFRSELSSLTGGIVLIVLGVITWAVVGGWILVAVGALLAILAGAIWAAEAFLTGQNRGHPAP